MTLSFRPAACAIFGLLVGNVSPATETESSRPPVQAITIEVLDDNLGLSDFPGDEYQVPDSQVIISGRQNPLGDFALGLVGVPGNSVADNARKAKTQAVTQALGIRASVQAREMIRELIAGAALAERFSEAAPDAKAALTIRTAIILTYVNDTDLRPTAFVKANLKSADRGAPKWSSRYFASSATPLPLVGDSSWTSDGGARLRGVVTEDLRRAIEFMLDDVSAPATRDPKRLTAVEANFPYVRSRYQMTGFLLRETDSHIYYQPKIPNYLVMAGVNILPKDSITYRPAVKGDPTKKEIKPPRERPKR
jgi:hypothetical protein